MDDQAKKTAERVMLVVNTYADGSPEAIKMMAQMFSEMDEGDALALLGGMAGMISGLAQVLAADSGHTHAEILQHFAIGFQT